MSTPTPIKTPPAHVQMTQFPVKDGELLIGGISLSQLAARVGRTPFYAYDRQLLNQRIDALRAALPPQVKLHYAMKANPMPALVCHMASRVDGIDVASAGELKVALDAGATPREISFAGPGKTDAELRQAVAAGILINVESFREVPVLAAVSQTLGLPARVAVRVNPDFELKSSGMKMGGGPQAVWGRRRARSGTTRSDWRSRPRIRGFSPVCRLAKPESGIHCRGPAEKLRPRTEAGRICPGACPLPESWRRFRHPLLPGRTTP